MLMYTNMRLIGDGGFMAYNYWSSSEDVATYVYIQGLGNGAQATGLKTSTRYLRPVRAF